ncbi:MAG: sugar transferase [Bacteroidales bacterium]|nr:sugar transferase [Bacteroidales bacterium]
MVARFIRCCRRCRHSTRHSISCHIPNSAFPTSTTKDDDRVTPWGRFLRHSSIDELPQFINVFKGDMSVVGPRPHMLAHTEYYSQRISDYMIRHYVKPGITGWAQTHGERGETKEVEDMARRVEKDIWYVEHWSLSLDLHIIVKTIRDAIVGDSKAY